LIKKKLIKLNIINFLLLLSIKKIDDPNIISI